VKKLADAALVRTSIEEASAAFARGDYPTALSMFRPLAERGDVKAQVNIGAMHFNGLGVRQDYAEAMRWFRRAADQGDATAQNNLGMIHFNGLGLAKDHGEAMRWFRLAADQGHAGAQNNLGLMYLNVPETGQDLTEAMRWFRFAADQGFADAQVNLGWGYEEGRGVPKDPAQAMRLYGLAAEQGHAGAWHNLGAGHSAANRPREAVDCFSRALLINPNLGKTRFNLAFERLSLGDYERGWPDYEARFSVKRHPPRKFPGRQWRGEDVRAKTVFVHAEQGFGDCIQFARFAPRLKQTGARVVLECHPKLYRLLQSAKGVDALVRLGDPLPAYDFYCPLGSLPLLLKLNTQADLAAVIPYLRPPSDAGIKLAPALVQTARRFKVGIAWSGNVNFRHDRQKSTNFDTFLPLAEVPGVQLFSLQFGPRAEQLGAEQLKTTGAGAGIIDLTPMIDDFADTAVALAGLDLVISVDTGLVHLAGALGRPAWVVLPFVADFRWLRDREDCPWYPSLRLFRMAHENDWPGVIARVTDALKQMTGSPT
jgi:tetratricopeptide (TPR) repeat protein